MQDDEMRFGEPDSLDAIAGDLLALKDAAGPVSYAELVRRIAQLRVERGMNPAAAQPPRTTVYDAFRPGRARVDVGLLRDIVLALGADADEADRWVLRYQRTRRTDDVGPRVAAAPRPRPATGAPRQATSPLTAPHPLVSRRTQALIMLGCLIVNFIGMSTVQLLHLPIYLDMAGTAVAAMVFGPWAGVVVGLSTNVFGFVVGAPGAAPFALVNVAGALVWGYGIRRFGMGADLFRYVNLTLLVAVACSLVGAPLGVLMFGGYSGHGSDNVTSSIAGLGLPVVAAAFSANILTSVIDKLLSGFIALVGIAMLRSRVAVPTAQIPLVERLIAPNGRAPGAGIGLIPLTHRFIS
ncbi:ECF transporter S component [Microbacterium sp. 2P01SA-2]|uniref:ECF transporter S component n=1 Tax=unclassified Microbacterium TaxID=2609290 RepID=UPI0039A308E4